MKKLKYCIILFVSLSLFILCPTYAAAQGVQSIPTELTSVSSIELYSNKIFVSPDDLDSSQVDSDQSDAPTQERELTKLEKVVIVLVIFVMLNIMGIISRNISNNYKEYNHRDYYK